jgi:hypothetical protein
MDNYKEILNSLNDPLILNEPISDLHKIFVKYTSHPYFKYSFDLLETLCNKTNYDNKKRLLHMSLTYLTKILFNSGNTIYISNFDTMILCCFNLGIKTIENQKCIPCLNKLKKIYKEKYINYQKEEIVKVELICIKLLNYKINILTVYDCLYYLLNKNKYLLELATKELENQLMNKIKENIYKKPLDLANEIIFNLKNKNEKIEYPKLLKRKIVPKLKHININSKQFDIKSVKNSSSSYNKNHLTNHMNSNKILTSNKKNSQVYSHQDKYSNIISHISKNKSNIFNMPISLVLPNPGSNFYNYEKNKNKKSLTRNMAFSSSRFINSFTNLNIELNNSPGKKTNCESSSPCGSEGISSYIMHNNSGNNLIKNSSNGNVFKKPRLCKKNIKTFFGSYKKNHNGNNNDFNGSQEYLFGDSPQKILKEIIPNKCFLNTFYYEKEYENNQSKNRGINIH